MPTSQFLRDLYVARTTAFSRNTDPRNYEHVWYPFWNLVSTHLAKRLHLNALVAPQYPLWCLWRRDEDFPTIFPGDSEMDVDEDASGDPATAGDTEDFLGDDESPNVSFALSSVASTIDHESRRRITDFAIILETITNIDLHWVQDQWEDSVDVIMPIPGRDLFAEHVSELVLSLIEIKSCPSRSLREENRGELHQNRMVQAQNDVLIQAAYFFTSRRWLGQRDVILIAAVGDCWCYTVASRTVFEASASEDDPYWEPEASDQMVEAAAWSDEVRYGTAESVRLEQQMVGLAGVIWQNA